MWNFLKIDLLLNKSFTQNFKRKILKERKVKDQIRKIVSQKKHPRTWIYTNHSIFLKEVSGLLKLYFPLKDLIMEGYFWLSLGNIFCGFLVVSFFLRGVFCSPEKNSEKLINENLSKVRWNTSPQKRWKNEAKRRQSQTYT